MSDMKELIDYLKKRDKRYDKQNRKDKIIGLIVLITAITVYALTLIILN